jgi:hypothetical protein
MVAGKMPAPDAVTALTAMLDSGFPDLVVGPYDRAGLEAQVRQLRAAVHASPAEIVPVQIAARMAGPADEAAQPTPGGDGIPQRPEEAITPATRWQPLVEALVRAVALDEVGWPGLAAGLDRAAAAGWDVTANLPLLAAQRELPDRHPARELYCRLVGACAAASVSVPSVPEINGSASTATSSARHHAEPARLRPVPNTTQLAPSR